MVAAPPVSLLERALWRTVLVVYVVCKHCCLLDTHSKMCVAYLIWLHEQAPDLSLLVLFNRDELLTRQASAWQCGCCTGSRLQADVGVGGGRHH